MRICFGWYPDTAILPAADSPVFDTEHSHGRQHAQRASSNENRGFIVVGDAVRQMLDHNRDGSAHMDLRRPESGAIDVAATAAYINMRFDILVLGMSYEISAETECTYTVEVLRAVKIPLVVLGLSVVDESLAPDCLHPSVMELLRHFNSNARIFGVRAQSTQRWLANYGFEKAEPLGCPSLHTRFRHNSNNAYDRHRARSPHIATGGYLLRDKVRGRLLCEAFAGLSPTYILQDEVHYLSSEKQVEPAYQWRDSEYNRVDMGKLVETVHGVKSPFARYHLFNDMNSWRECLGEHTVYVGDRFHGAVAAIQAGLPVIVICKDVRSMELCDFYDIPSISLEYAAQVGVGAIIDGFVREDVGDRMRGTIDLRHEALKERLSSVGLSLTMM